MNKTMVNVALTSLMASDAALSARLVIGPMVEEKLDSENMTEQKLSGWVLQKRLLKWQ